MTRYPYLLFDADNTLFDFDEANIHAFRAVCDAFGLPFSLTLLIALRSSTTQHGSALTAGS